MQNQSSTERFAASSPRARRLLRQEELILEATEILSAALEERHLNRAELASRLEKSKGFVSQILAGGRNLTLRTLADVADALQCRVRISLEPVGQIVTGRASSRASSLRWGSRVAGVRSRVR